MNRDEATKLIKAKLNCMIRESSKKNPDCLNKNCTVCKLYKDIGSETEQIEAMNSLLKLVDLLKIAEWIKKDQGKIEFDAVCSNCNYETTWSLRSKFCPNCGFEMRGL